MIYVEHRKQKRVNQIFLPQKKNFQRRSNSCTLTPDALGFWNNRMTAICCVYTHTHKEMRKIIFNVLLPGMYLIISFILVCSLVSELLVCPLMSPRQQKMSMAQSSE